MDSIKFEYIPNWIDYKVVAFYKIIKTPRFYLIAGLGLYLIFLGVFDFLLENVNEKEHNLPVVTIVYGLFFLFGIPLIQYLFRWHRIKSYKSKLSFEINKTHITWKSDGFESKALINKLLKSSENDNVFDISIDKKQYLIIPKRILNENQINFIRRYLILI